MKRRSQKSRRTERSAGARAVSYGSFAGAVGAALLAVSPVNITVTLSPGPPTVVAADVPNPVCQATLTR
ncbi:hypothetical protein ACQEWB_33590 [Streptomyces sp. CA-249302]|uniref:hypothetical protein n=1 Tax=Streptomyces sp. CA-249302 TaxID=3240058 RepID=UPI003D94D914